MDLLQKTKIRPSVVLVGLEKPLPQTILCATLVPLAQLIQGLVDSACLAFGANFKLITTATIALHALLPPGMIKSDKQPASTVDRDTGGWRLVLLHQMLAPTAQRDIIARNHAQQSLCRVLLITTVKKDLPTLPLAPFFFNLRRYPRLVAQAPIFI